MAPPITLEAPSERLRVWGFWGFGVLGFWGFGVLGFWGFGVLGYWGIGVLDSSNIGTFSAAIQSLQKSSDQA